MWLTSKHYLYYFQNLEKVSFGIYFYPESFKSDVSLANAKEIMSFGPTAAVE